MKKLVCLSLCLTMAASAAGAARFSDVPSSHWAYNAVERMAQEQIIKGVGNDRFAPGQTLNYASFSTMLARTFYPTESSNASKTMSTPWWMPYLWVLNDQGVTSGTKLADSTAWLRVTEESISRNEMAALMYNLAVKRGFALPDAAAVQAAKSGISDFPSIPSQYQTAVATCYAAKLLSGGDGGKFNGGNFMTRAEAAAVITRLMDLDGDVQPQNSTVTPLQTNLDWGEANRFGRLDYSVSRPKTGYATGYYTIANGDGTVSGLVVDDGSHTISVERFDAGGAAVSRKTLPQELPMFGAFLAGKQYNYIAYGQKNETMLDGQEVWRIVQYDKDWNRLGAVSANGGQTYTKEPFRSTVARMAESGDGQVALYASRTRYDGHQSNITFIMNTAPFQMKTVMGEEFPSNHVSHSFGQFIQFDGSEMVTVDHGDAYPRSFVLQKGTQEEELFPFTGAIGENVTNAIGSGFELSGSGALFLACSAPQDNPGQNWRVLLLTADKNGSKTGQTWLTDGSANVDCARLVKLDENRFVAMWGVDGTLHYQLLNGSGQPAAPAASVPNTPMPPTQPVVQNGTIQWIQLAPSGKPCLYTLAP